MPSTTSIYSTVKNVSGGTRTFSYLPPHGREMAANASLSFVGDLYNAITRDGRPSRILASLEADLVAGYIEIIKTPSPILYDATANNTKILVLNNRVLYAVDPSWDAAVYSSSL